MEDRAVLVIGSDLSASSLVKRLCESGFKGILVVDNHTEPGGFLGTQYSVGFRFEKMPLLVPESISGYFGERGYRLQCRDMRVRIAKEGDHVAKATCWRRGSARPWWYPETGERLCYCSRGWGSAIRSIVSSHCSEYTYYTPRKIDVTRRIAVLRNGRVIRYRAIVSSYPLPLLIDSLYDEKIAPKAQALVKSLEWVDMLNIALGVRGEPPGMDIVIHGTRASRAHTLYIWSNIDQGSAPPGHYLLEILMSYCRERPPPPDQVSRAFTEARWARLVSSRESIVSERVYTLPYITPTGVDREILRELSEYLAASNIFLIGVGGRWENLSPEDQIEDGEKILGEVLRAIR